MVWPARFTVLPTRRLVDEPLEISISNDPLQVLIWLKNVHDKLGENYTKQELTDFIWKTLKAGQVLPGYGHAVLRKTDPRFTTQNIFAKKVGI